MMVNYTLPPRPRGAHTVDNTLRARHPFIWLSIQHFIFKQLHLCLIEAATTSPTFE